MNSKVAILFLALCSMYSRALSRLEKRQSTAECIAALDLSSSELAGLPAFCADIVNTPPIDLCRNCTGASCRALTGDIADLCRQSFYDGCQDLGVELPDCQADLPSLEDCLLNLAVSSDPDLLRLPGFCADLINTPADQLCRECTGTSCRALTGDIAAGCRRLFYLGCRAVGVTVTDCSGAMGLVAIKGVLTVILLVAAFLIF